MDETGKPLETDGVGARVPPAERSVDGLADGLVECPACTEVSGSDKPVRHLPPVCQYDRPLGPVRGAVPNAALDGLAFPATAGQAGSMVVDNRPVPPERVADSMRERLAKPGVLMISQEEYDRIKKQSDACDRLLDYARDKLKGFVALPGERVDEFYIRALGRYDHITGDTIKLATFLVEEMGENGTPGESDVDCAIRIMRRLAAVAAQRAAGWDALKTGAELADKLALCFRSHYQREIESGAHNRFPDGAECAIHYLLIERDLTQRGLWGRLKYVLWGV